MSKEASAPSFKHPVVVRVLIDMDEVIAATEIHFLNMWRARYPDLPYIELKDRVGQYPHLQYEELYGPAVGQKVLALCIEPRFFAEIPPMPGAIGAVKELSETEGVEVFLCTAGISWSNYHATDKLDWVSQHLGQHWVSRVIIASDKTLIHGDLLIDDRVEISGSNKNPSWKHIFFKSYWNRREDVSKQALIIEQMDSWRQTDKLTHLIQKCREEKCSTK